MANPNAAHEPSMEEILASIRQIISEDGSSAAPKIDGVRTEPAGSTRERPDAEPAGEAEAAAPASDAEVAEPAAAAEPESEYRGFMPGQAATSAADNEGSPLTERARTRSQIATRLPRADEDDERLLSPASGDLVSGAFGALAHTLLAHNNTRTLEEVVTGMLQPMLKQWLDDNLPSIVERKVQEEIERVSRGRR